VYEERRGEVGGICDERRPEGSSLGVSGGPGAGSENAWQLAGSGKAAQVTCEAATVSQADLTASELMRMWGGSGSNFVLAASRRSTRTSSFSSSSLLSLSTRNLIPLLPFDCIVITTFSSLLHHRFEPFTSLQPTTVTDAHSLALLARHSSLLGHFTLGPSICCYIPTATAKHRIPHAHTACEARLKSYQTSHLRGRDGFLRRRHASQQGQGERHQWR
jgi:hypothetical protein